MTWLALIQLSRILRWRDERRQRHRPSQRRHRMGCFSGILPLVATIPDGGALIYGRPRPRGWPSALRGSVCLSPSCSAWSSWGSEPCSGSCRCPARAPELCWEKYVSVGKIKTNPDADWYLFVGKHTKFHDEKCLHIIRKVKFFRMVSFGGIFDVKHHWLIATLNTENEDIHSLQQLQSD